MVWTCTTPSDRSRDDGVTPTPVISRAILVYNRGRKEHLADGSNYLRAAIPGAGPVPAAVGLVGHSQGGMEAAAILSGGSMRSLQPTR